MGEDKKVKVVNGISGSIKYKGEPIFHQGGDDNMKLYKYVILDRDTGITTGEGWVTGGDREQAMAAVPTHEHSLDRIKVFLKKFGSYEQL